VSPVRADPPRPLRLAGDDVVARVLMNAYPGLVTFAESLLRGKSGARQLAEDVVATVLLRTMRLADGRGWTQLAAETLDEAAGDETEACRLFREKEHAKSGHDMEAYLSKAVRNEARTKATEAWHRYVVLAPKQDDDDTQADDAYLETLSRRDLTYSEVEEQAVDRVGFADWTHLSADVIALARWTLVLLGDPKVPDALRARCPNVDRPEWLVDWCSARDALLRYVQLCLDSHWQWHGPGRTYAEANPGWTPVRQLAYLLLVVDAARARVADNSAHVAATGAEIESTPVGLLVAELVDAHDAGPALLQRRAAHTLQASDYANPRDPRPPAIVARQSTHEARREVCRYLTGTR
jgi:hypothetical protein